MIFAKLFDDDSTVDLDELWQQDMQDERNRTACEDSLRSTDPDEVNCEQLEYEWREQWTEDDWTQFQDFINYDPDRPVEENIGAADRDNLNLSLPEQSCAALDQQNATIACAPYSVVAQLQSIRKQAYAQPVQNAVQTVSTSKSASTPYDAAQNLIRSAPLIYIGKNWLIYRNGFYSLASTEDVKRLIMAVCRPDVKRSGNANFVDQVYKILKSEPGLYIHPDFTRNAVAFDDCVLDLDRWQILPPTPEIVVTTHFPASFNRGEKTDCPVFKRFLYDVSLGDSVLQERIWQALGYLLVPDQHGKAIVLLQGRMHSGKSLFVNVVRSCFDDEVVVSLPVNEFSRRFSTSSLFGKKLCVDADLSDERLSRDAVSALKKMTGSDSISGDVKFGDYVRFENSAKFLYATNHALLLPNKDAAFYDRLIVVPFARSVPREARDFHLEERFCAERDAIIVQALAGYRRLVQSDYHFAGNFQINAITEDGGDNLSDMVLQFLREDCEAASDGWTPTDYLYAAFVGKFGLLCSDKRFSELLLQTALSFGYPVGKVKSRIPSKANPVWGFTNLKLKGAQE